MSIIAPAPGARRALVSTDGKTPAAGDCHGRDAV